MGDGGLADLINDLKSVLALATITALAQLALNNLCVNEVIKVLEDETERITEEDIKGFAEEVLEDIKNGNCAESL